MADWKRILAAVLLIPCIMISFTGCWDNQEIDSLFIITGIGLDTVENTSDQLSISLQIGTAAQNSSEGSGGASGQADQSTIMMNATSDTVLTALNQLNRNSDHQLILHHNQALIFSMELAQRGIEEQLDLFLRDQQARVEVPIVIAEGRAEELLSAELEQNPISGLFISGMFDDLSKKSVQYRIRLIDFVSHTLDESAAALVPIVALTGEEDNQSIEMTGMAVFKQGKMIGRLDTQNIKGFLFAMGTLKNCDIEVSDENNQAVFHVSTSKCKKKVSIRDDGGVKVSVEVNTTLSIGEVSGFSDLQPQELMDHLTELAQENITKQITDTFEIAKSLNADIYGFSTTLYKHHNKEWKSMQENWDAIFQNIELEVQVHVKIPSTGQIVPTVEIEEAKE